MGILSDKVTEPFEYMSDLSPIWWILGVVAVVAVITAVLIVMLKKKRGGK